MTVTAVTLPFFINTTCVELTLIAVLVFEAKNPGNARAGAAENSSKQALSKAENEKGRAFIAREAIRFFSRSSVNRVLLGCALPRPLRIRVWSRVMSAPAGTSFREQIRRS